ncbi:MAG: hypothetical protein MZV64_20165 [Ignavibacteriales bacterium]|nr:hypothetical protein [Ignavibacteriales bacterium]
MRRKNKFSPKLLRKIGNYAFEHDPFYAFAAVEKAEIGIKVEEKFNEF